MKTVGPTNKTTRADNQSDSDYLLDAPFLLFSGV